MMYMSIIMVTVLAIAVVCVTFTTSSNKNTKVIIIDDNEEKKRKRRSSGSNCRSSSEKSDKAEVSVESSKSDEPFGSGESSKSKGSGKSHNSDDPNDDLYEPDTSSDEKKLFQKIDELLSLKLGNLDHALTLLKVNEFKYSGNVDFLWRLAQAYSMKYEQEFNSSGIKEYVIQGMTHMETAMKINPTNSDVKKWHAVLFALMMESEGRIEQARKITKLHELLTNALLKKPEDWLLCFIYGTLNYELSILSDTQKYFLSYMSGSLPETSIDNAIQFINISVSNCPIRMIAPKYFLAKCYIEKRKYDTALRYLEDAEQITPTTQREENYKEECRILRLSL